MKPFRLRLSLPLVALLCVAFQVGADEKPTLVVQITVDGMRADELVRFRHHFAAERGFRRLMNHGAWFRDAQYHHATTFTAVGHATLFTGAETLGHGIAGNDWQDRETQAHSYCVGDAASPIIGEPTAPEKGRSPKNLTCTTIGDELVMTTGARSRMYSISFKDRGAILPGGHLGKACWYSSATGRFVTSSYYYDENPEWLDQWNAAGRVDDYRDATWDLLQEPGRYTYASHDDRSCEKGHAYLGIRFPHAMKTDSIRDFHKALPYTPFADALLGDLARHLIRHERLGRGDATDMLAISFSATDYIHHAWGPLSLEAEDNMARLDTTLAELFDFLDEAVGRDKTLIILSADHGFDDVPECKLDMHLAAGRHDPQRILASANEALRRKLNVTEDLVSAFWNPSLYLNLDNVRELGLDVERVEHALADHMLDYPGIAFAVARSDLLRGQVPDHPIMRAVQRAFHPQRSGNVIIVQEPHWYLYPEPEEFAAMHGSPWAYDTHVPLLFCGPGILPARIARPVGPEDIAPTLALYLDISIPSAAIGNPLPEVLGSVFSLR